jgi:hypothetical protein
MGTRHTATVTFQSELFNTSEQHENFVNPDCFGEDLCEFLLAELKARNIDCGDTYGEDWGWALDFTFEGKTYQFGTNYIPGEGWSGFIRQIGSLWNEFTGTGNLIVQAKIIQLFDNILRNAEGINSIHWSEETRKERYF